MGSASIGAQGLASPPSRHQRARLAQFDSCFHRLGNMDLRANLAWDVFKGLNEESLCKLLGSNLLNTTFDFDTETSAVVFRRCETLHKLGRAAALPDLPPLLEKVLGVMCLEDFRGLLESTPFKTFCDEAKLSEKDVQDVLRLVSPPLSRPTPLSVTPSPRRPLPAPQLCSLLSITHVRCSAPAVCSQAVATVATLRGCVRRREVLPRAVLGPSGDCALPRGPAQRLLSSRVQSAKPLPERCVVQHNHVVVAWLSIASCGLRCVVSSCCSALLCHANGQKRSEAVVEGAS